VIRRIDIQAASVTPHAVQILKDSCVQLTPVAGLRAAALAGLFLLPGCVIFSDEPHYRGIAVSQHDLDELTPGISSEADAQAVLGPPTVQEVFDNNNWIYISQVTKMRIGRTEGVKQQHVVVLTFDDSGVLRNVSQKTQKDAVTVAMDGSQTPVPGGKAGFIQQLIGGVGSYNPLGAASDTSGTGASGLGAGAGGLGSGGGL
jgi:outer membrane protein assembly factor BamE (lipoprotein component of BamABCDE complex)